jgi:hypothetical protein
MTPPITVTKLSRGPIGLPPSEERDPIAFSKSRLGQGIVGGCFGFAFGLWGLVQWSTTHTGAKGLLFLVAGSLFGTLVGLDVHSTRHWQRVGRPMVIARLGLACMSAASLTALAGVPLGLIRAGDIWQFSLGGAALGIFLGLRIAFDV